MVKGYNYRRRPRKSFQHDAYTGSTVDISFDIVHETQMGPESIRFETTIRYLDEGKGEPLLLVHGIGQSLFTWRQNIDYFAENGYRVLAMDLAGCGYSGYPNIYYTVEENALIIRAFLDALRIKKTHIAAFSTGALSAVCFAHAYPQRIGRLVLVSPGGPHENYPFALKFLTTWLGRTVFLARVSESSVRRMLVDLYFDTTQITDDVVDGYYAPLRCREVREALVMMMMHFDDAYPRSLLKSIRHKTLVISGTEDRLHDEKTIREYALTIPGAEHLNVRNCGHFVHEEKAERFNHTVREFLKGQPEQQED